MNYTSIEQSKKLLELGLKAESADACYDVGYGQTKAHIECENFISYFTNDEYPELKDRFVPCWSTGALLELVPKHPKFNTVFRFLESQVDGSYKYIWIFECHAVSEYTFEGTSDFDCIYQAIVWLLQNNYIETEKK